MKNLFLFLILFGSLFSKAQVTSLSSFDKPNFICQTRPNAAKMFLQAKVYTDFYTKLVRIYVSHVSTYREEMIISSQEYPHVVKPNYIAVKAEFDNSSSAIGSGLIPPKIGMSLVKMNGSIWTGTFDFYVYISNQYKLRHYEMSCLKY